MDLLAAIDNIPNAETVVYNQIVFLPNQKRELACWTKEEPARQYSQSEQPDGRGGHQAWQEVIARESKQLVYTHFNLIVAVPADTDLQNARTTWRMLSDVWVSIFPKGVQPTGTVRELVSG